MDERLTRALSRLTEGMDDKSRRHLELLMCVFELKDGEEIITEGKHSASMYIVYSGAMRVSIGQGKKRVELPELAEGDWVGEISLLDPGPASATVRVKGATTVLEFSHDALQKFVRDQPVSALQLLSALADDLAIRLSRTSDGLVQLGRSGLELVYPVTPEQAGFVTTMLRMLNRGKEET